MMSYDTDIYDLNEAVKFFYLFPNFKNYFYAKKKRLQKM